MSKIDILDKMEGAVEISKKGNILRLKKTFDLGEEGIPLDEHDRLKIDIHKDWHLQGQEKIKVGRNDPCPCGSGKKLKGAAEDKIHQNRLECKFYEQEKEDTREVSNMD